MAAITLLLPPHSEESGFEKKMSMRQLVTLLRCWQRESKKPSSAITLCDGGVWLLLLHHHLSYYTTEGGRHLGLNWTHSFPCREIDSVIYFLSD